MTSMRRVLQIQCIRALCTCNKPKKSFARQTSFSKPLIFFDLHLPSKYISGFITGLFSSQSSVSIMASTRRTSARLASSQTSDPPSSQEKKQDATSKKRKADNPSTPKSKKGKVEQQTLEETMPKQTKSKSADNPAEDNVAEEEEDIDDEDMKDAADEAEAQEEQAAAKKEQAAAKKEQMGNSNGDGEKKAIANETQKSETGNGHEHDKDASTQQNGDHEHATEMDDTGKLSKESPTKAASSGEGGAVSVSKSRADAMPSNILEKGVIYFFVRGRVGIDSPDSVQDLARSYMVLRPLPDGAKLGSGAIPDGANARLLALPKKVLPKSGRDRFMTFVEKAGVTVKQLKEEFMQGSDYDTKTTGTRHTPAVTPVGEGVYAITTQGRDSHLAYMLTIPETIGEVQEDIGLADKGSFVLSVKNPKASGPANTQLPQGPEWPEDMQEEFRGLRWMPLQPKHLEYPNCQLLLIGEHAGELGKAVDSVAKDDKNDAKETPQEELEKLEGEDEIRAEALKEDNLVFEDLKISHKDYPKLQTTW